MCRRTFFATVWVLASLCFQVTAADVNVLVIGSTKDASLSLGGTSSAFVPTAVVTHLRSILQGAGLGTIDVTYKDRYASGNGSYSYNLASWYHWPYPAGVETTTRWPNLRGANGTKWDYVVLIGDPYTMEYMPGLYSLGVAKIAKEVSAGTAETILLMPWPASGSSSSVNHYKEVVYRTGRSGGIPVAPAAMAWQAAGSPSGGGHPNSDGAYIAAATIFSRIYNQNATASSYSYKDSLADTAYATVVANKGKQQYTGTFSFQNPYLTLGDKRRDVHYSEKGTSTEQDYKGAAARAMQRSRVTYNSGSYSDKYTSNTPEDDGKGWPTANPMPIAWNHGRKFSELAKEYVVNPSYWQLGMGFMYQYNTWSQSVADANDVHICQMHSRGYYLADYMIAQHNTARNIPWRTIWAQIHREYPTLNPLRDGSGPHVNYDLREGVGTYMYTLYSGRCPLNPKPDPVTSRWFAEKTGYETAWFLGRCQSRAPGFKVMPSAATAKSIAAGETEQMSVQFILPPQNNVTVHIASSNPSIATVSPSQLTFTTSNYDTAQTVTVTGASGSSGAPVAIVYSTVSSDEVYDKLDDVWVYNASGPTSNTAPVALNQSTSTPEGTAKAIKLHAVDGENDPLTYSIVGNPANGSLSGTPPNVTYTPNAGFSGGDSFTFRASDASLNSNVATVSISVSSTGNQAPIAQSQSVSTPKNVAKVITLKATDANGDSLTYSIVTGPTNGSLSGTPPNVTYTPDTDYTGSDSFTFKANDGELDSNTATVSITVSPPANTPPVAQDQAVSTPEDTPKAITLVATDIDGDPLTYSIVSAPTNGSLSGTPPNVTYTPDTDFNGPDSFTFKANDSKADSNTATVSITVTSANDAPVASAQSITTDEDTGKAIVLEATDADGDTLTYSIVSGPSDGTLTGTPPNVTYMPDPNFNGSDSFTFKANDGSVDSNTATISITVDPVNDKPIASSDSYQTNQDTDLVVADPGVLGNDTDVDGDALTAVLVADVSNGSLILNDDGSFTYIPTTGFTGTDSFTYRAHDGDLSSSIATVTLKVGVTTGNNPPTADSQAVTAASGFPKSIVLTADDPDGDSLTFSIVSGPTQGSLSGTIPNLVYTSTPGYTGPDSFTFRVHDGTVYSNTATVSITVTESNTPPAANNMSVKVFQNMAKTFNLNVSDADGDALTCSVVGLPAHGTVTFNGRKATYTPDSGYLGSDSFTYKADDGAATSTTATVSIQVVERVVFIYEGPGSGGVLQGEEGCSMRTGSDRHPLAWYLPLLLAGVVVFVVRRRLLARNPE